MMGRKELALALVVVVCWTCVVDALSVEASRAAQFRAFVSKYKRPYKHSPEEYAIRQQIFLEKLDFIETFNRESASSSVGINELADLTDAEYAQRLSFMDYSADVHDYSTTSVAPPASVDWRTSTNPKVVGPVREMGQCASSAAISIIDSISGDYSIKFSEDYYRFNTSYVTDCDGSKCSGTTTDAVWGFIKKFGLQWYYDNGCPTGPGVGICISGPTCVAAGNETALQNIVATKGPVSILIDASQTSFQLYTSGIYSDTKCSATKASLSLLLVGYGSANGEDYWIARNAWGANWGQNGDILIARNKNNLCGVATSACYATTVGNCVCSI